jgi:transposase
MNIRARFDFVSTSPEAVAQRKAAIQHLAAQGMSNRDIAKKLGCTIWTVRYWLNPQTREKRIAYKAQRRMAA